MHSTFLKASTSAMVNKCQRREDREVVESVSIKRKGVETQYLDHLK